MSVSVCSAFFRSDLCYFVSPLFSVCLSPSLKSFRARRFFLLLHLCSSLLLPTKLFLLRRERLTAVFVSGVPGLTKKKKKARKKNQPSSSFFFGTHVIP